MPLPAGSVLAGRYRLMDRIGGPDWSPLWKGSDGLLSRPVTMRLFPSGPVPARVAAAVQGTAQLADPRLARIYDAGYQASVPYVVSEWVPGERLDDLLARHLPSPRLAARIVAEIAGALAVGHAAGQAHLCLTPAFVRWHGSGVKITGLGIEAALRGLPSAAHPAAAAADTRALGGLLYALLTGYWPGRETTLLPPAPRARGQLYSPQQVRAGVPGPLSAVACRALQPGQAEPVRTPAQLIQALRDAQLPARRRAAIPSQTRSLAQAPAAGTHSGRLRPHPAASAA